MKRSVAALGLSLVLVAGGCSDWLSGPDIDSDPNRASSATANQLLGGVQANATTVLTGHLARVLSMWVQQMAGTDRQYTGYDLYTILESTFSGEFNSAYTGGGLVDLRSIQKEVQANGDRTYLGIAKVWEAILIANTADLWGAIPYSEAANPDNPTPKLDTQAEVYAALQTLLDAAIADLAANVGVGPASADLIYGGDRTKWTQVARMLKARIHLHGAETAPANYALALAQANQGIATPANDFRTYQTTAAGEQNMWFQFFRERDSYIRGGKFLVDLLIARSDPRLPRYFGLNGSGTRGGARPGEGLDDARHSWLSDARGDAGFRQPIMTWAENQLIIAEAQARSGLAGELAARTALNAVRTDAGLANVSPVLSGAALLTAILQEKYIVLFQNIEAYNDYKRTCYPNIAPASAAFSGNIPARLFYSSDERNANPKNIPSPSAQPRRNLNDPVTATAPDGAACLGQRS